MSVATMSILEREVRAKGGGGGGGMGLSLFPRGILRSGGTSVKFRFTKKPCLLALTKISTTPDFLALYYRAISGYSDTDITPIKRE